MLQRNLALSKTLERGRQTRKCFDKSTKKAARPPTIVGGLAAY